MATARTVLPNPALIEDLVAANRILSNEGVVDGFGHVSVRHDSLADAFLLARSMAPGLVTASDIMMFGLNGEALGDDRRTAYVERYIHSEIYKAQPGVVAVVHSHSPAVIPFTQCPPAAGDIKAQDFDRLPPPRRRARFCNR